MRSHSFSRRGAPRASVAFLAAASLVARVVAAGAPQPAPAAPPPSAPTAPPTGAPTAPPATPPAPTTDPATSPPTKPATGDEGPSEANKAEARAHFEKGLTLLREDAWAPALAEFQKSRELYPTRSATNNAAVALRKLQRFDESLSMFEALIRDFPNITPGERETAQKAIAELRQLVGTIDIAGAEPGAAMVVSGLDKGEYPPVVPIRVSAGSHVVRIFKEGFEPFEARVDVAGGQSARVEAKMKKLTDSGRLKISERGGLTVEVLVDNVVVGVTPWEGLVAVGNHTVLLRGKGKLGTQPATAGVKSQQVTTLSLTAEELESSLRVEPTPVGATVAIDSVTVGNGAWIGRLKTGAHKIEVTADGFQPHVESVDLKKGDRPIVKVALERDPNAAFWRKPPKVAIEVTAGLSIVPTYGGDIVTGCAGGCSQGVGLGAMGFVHGTYELGSGIGFGVSAGYFFNTQTIADRDVTLTPFSNGTAPAPQTGKATDDLRLSSFLGGAHLSYHFGETVPVLLRLGGGVLVGQLRDARTATLTDSTGALFDTDPSVTYNQLTSIYIDPELKVGLRLAEHAELSAGVQVMMLVGIDRPKWDNKIEVSANADGLGTYAPDAIMGQFVIGVTPTASFRYDF